MFANVTWKQAVADQVLGIVNSSGSPDFSLADVYERLDDLQRLFPHNHHVPDKVRQILQQLRDDGFITFVSRAQYRIDLSSPHLHTETPVPLPSGRPRPPTRVARTTVRLRDTILGLTLKTLYRFRCQACGQTVPLTDSDYAESHHLRPLGRPHEGPDTPGNVIVLCPNHHTMFGRGAAAIVPETLRLVHARPGLALPKRRIHLLPGHRLARAHVLYHYRQIFRGLAT